MITAFLVLCLLRVPSVASTEEIKNDSFLETKPSNAAANCRKSSGVSETEITNAFFDHHLKRHFDRPVKDATKPVVVRVRLGIQGIDEIDEKQQTIGMYGYLSLRWYDEIHRWNDSGNSTLSCINYIVVPPGRDSGVWIPDFAFTNSVDDKYALTRSASELVRIYSDGLSVYSPKGTLRFRCILNLSFFPFDVQKCALHFESWKYTHDAQVLEFLDQPVAFVNMTEHEQWDIITAQAVAIDLNYLQNADVFDAIEFRITFKRKPGYYVIAIIVPTIIIALVEACTFSIPIHKGTRLVVSFTLLLAYTVFLLMVEEDMPRSSRTTPMLSLFVFLMIVYIAFAILFQSIVLVFVDRANASAPIAKSLSSFFYCFARVVCIKPYDPDAEEEDGADNASTAGSGSEASNSESSAASSKKKLRKQWLNFAEIFDRFSWCAYLFIVIATTFIMFVFVPAAHDAFHEDELEIEETITQED